VCGNSSYSQEKDEKRFDDLLAQVKKSDPKSDFLKLRMAFTKTAAYNPYDLDNMIHEEMATALDNKKYDKAIQLAEKVLSTRFVDVNAHSVASRAYTALEKAEQAKFHSFVREGLVQSILKSGDGKAAATAYVVISIDEENAVLSALGIRKSQQSLLEEKGTKFDRIVGVEEKRKERVTLYFNISRQFAWLEDQFKKGK
jgi:hypothetical protein